MILSESRVGHSIGHKVYLAKHGTSLAAHKDACKKAYGNLRGVRFHEFPAGSKLESAGCRGEYWRLA